MVTNAKIQNSDCDCAKTAVERAATIQSPYHFVESGLPNVYLVGIRYWVCRNCGKQSADIPYLKDLMVKIARAVVRQETPLDGAEIRFLRKRLGKKSSDFAKLLGFTPEHFSRLESPHTDHNPSVSADKLIRVYYSLLSGDEALKDTMNSNIEAYMASLHGEEQASSFRAELHNHEWEAESVPA
jgi:putative zinc finger/helix-turn-helix YgiT family protein